MIVSKNSIPLKCLKYMGKNLDISGTAPFRKIWNHSNSVLVLTLSRACNLSMGHSCSYLKSSVQSMPRKNGQYKGI